MILQQSRVLAVSLLASGCGGNGLPEPNQVAPTDFDTLLEYSNTRFIQLENLAYSELQSVPALGSASYAGAIEARMDDLPDGELAILANLDLHVDFASASPVTWAQTSATFLADGTALIGTLNVTDSAFDRGGDPLVDHTFSVGLSGTVAASGVPAIALNLQLEGDFFGEDRSHVAGNVVGRAQQGSGRSSVVGRFVVSN